MNPRQQPARFRGRYTRPGPPRGGRGFKPRTPQREEYSGPGAGYSMPPCNQRDFYYNPQFQQTPVYQQAFNYGQYSASGPCPQGVPPYVQPPPFLPQPMNHYQQITPPPYLPPTVSNIHSSYTQDVHEARKPIQGNATISERDPVEFLSELRPLTTFLEKTTTSGHICFAVEVDGREFKGYGLTKIGAKQNAAIDALRHTFNIVCTNTVDSDSDNESIASEVSNADSIANPRQTRTIQRFSDVQDEMEKNVFTFLVKECGGCTSTAIFKEKFNGLREDFDEWILNRKTILAVYKKAGKATYIAPLFKGAKVCCFYGGNKSCRNQTCWHFHICKFDLFGRCKKGIKCRFEHNFETGNNKDIKFRLGLDEFSDREIKIILQCRYPQVCPASQCEAPTPFDCPFLHTCFNFLKNKCKDSKCEKGHTLSDRHNKWVLSVYGMKKWSEEKLNPLIGLRKIPNDDTKIVHVSPDEEHDLASDFESFLVENEAEGEDDKNVDVYNGVGHRLKLK